MLKQTQGLAVYVPAWTLDKLQAARVTMRREATLTEADVRERFEAIGGIPRFAVAESKVYKQYVDSMSGAIVAFDFALPGRSTP
jgi:hypothetical protein